MLANGIKETTTTTGTGTLTLASVPGFTRFSAAFSVGDRAAYCIKDGNNMEWGVGTVGASNTLERTFLLATLDSGVYLSSPAGSLTPITLASGTAEVICTVHDLLLPELGLNYMRVPPVPDRLGFGMLGISHVSVMEAIGNGLTNYTQFGTTVGVVGTATGRAVTTTNKLTSSLRVGIVSAATAGSSASLRFSITQKIRGGGAGLGGFFSTTKFGVSDAALVAGSRMFVGMSSSSAVLTNVDQSTIDNTIGLNIDAGDANFNILSRGTTATKIDLGSSFSRAAVGNNSHLMTLTLWCPPNESFVGYRVSLEGGAPAEATGVLTSNLPAASTPLALHVWRNNGTTAAAVGVDVNSMLCVSPQ